MVTFLHLSDIHFINRDHGTQFDLDQQIRRALLDDVETKPADGMGYDGVLITGDIAYSGQHTEYARAKEFLDELYHRIGDLAANTFMVPGNHDVDRNFVSPDLPLWAAHARLREANDPTVWRDHIYKQLVKDPQRTLLAPLKAYNDFAQGFGCFTGMIPSPKAGEPDAPQIAWQRIFEKPLDDGTLVQLHGLNSVLVSDEGDAPGKLLVSEFQTAKLENQATVVNLLMCHHPPEWLMDKGTIRNALRSFVPVSLFGHEHNTRLTADNKEVHLFAGAVQPSRRDPGWLPTYHILQLAVHTNGTKRELLVRVHTREFTSDAPYRFRPRRNERESRVEEVRIELPPNRPQTPAPTISVASVSTHEVSSGSNAAMSEAAPKAPSPAETALHQLLVYFFQLHTPQRYQVAFKAALLRDGDDTMDPPAMWAEVFRRAKDEKKLSDFWAAVAVHTQALRDKPNPFAA
jgi:predicted MPP superfamily phosphohydrolase